MASTTLTKTKDGKRYWRIRVSRGKGKGTYTMNWYWPDGMTEKKAKSELNKVVAKFELECAEGNVLTQKEKREKAATEKAELSKIKTLTQYATQVFMPTKELSLAENTRDSYQRFIDTHIIPALGNHLIIDIKPAMIQSFLLAFQKKGYAHATCIKLYNILNGIFTMAFMDETLETNPMARVTRPSMSKEQEYEKEYDDDVDDNDDDIDVDDDEKAYTVDEVRYIIECIKKAPLKWRALIYLTIDTGARRGEIVGLMWKNINLDSGTIIIRHNYQYTKKKGTYFTSSKNTKKRKVDIGEETIKILKEWKQVQSSTCASPYVFSQENSAEPMFPQSPTRYFKRFGKRFNIKDFHPHKLRHTNASIALLHGADVVSVSKRLGHSDPAVTLKMYSHSNEESKRKAGDIARNAIKGV